MSREEHIRNEGLLAEARRTAQDLKIRIKGLKDAIRIKCGEFDPPEDLESEVIRDLAFQLRSAHIDYLDIAKKIRSIEQALGR